MMIMFSDGSASAYCCICYLRWLTVTGYFVVLVAAKTRVAPLKIESIPRLELLGCLISSWLAVAVEEALPFIKIQGRGERELLSTFDGEKELDPGAPGFVLLESKNALAGTIMYQAHLEMYSSAKYTLAASRRFCWVIAGKQLADQVVNSCPPCRIERAKRVSPVMSDLSEDRVKPSEPFT
ncbi:MAG: hypothetical protein GY696_19920, partial [Gammaproteobacteria bacterium]|nr:hypothetical protein [Gammaproteobacteria bacterium]